MEFHKLNEQTVLYPGRTWGKSMNYYVGWNSTTRNKCEIVYNKSSNQSAGTATNKTLPRFLGRQFDQLGLSETYAKYVSHNIIDDHQ